MRQYSRFKSHNGLVELFRFEANVVAGFQDGKSKNRTVPIWKMLLETQIDGSGKLHRGDGNYDESPARGL